MPNDPVTKCLFKRCGKPITQVKIGRLKEYCSPTCRQGAFGNDTAYTTKRNLQRSDVSAVTKWTGLFVSTSQRRQHHEQRSVMRYKHDEDETVEEMFKRWRREDRQRMRERGIITGIPPRKDVDDE